MISTAINWILDLGHLKKLFMATEKWVSEIFVWASTMKGREEWILFEGPLLLLA
jgi:hypothetical protein